MGSRFAMGVFFIVISVFFLFPVCVESSQPVERTLTGCVIGKTFFDVKPDRAYAIRFSQALNLESYEGMTISVHGWLLPGDFFRIKDGTSPRILQNTCDSSSIKVINRESSIKYRVNALKTARNGNFNEALLLIDKAMSLDNTDCDAYVDRAQIQCMRNDFASAAKDLDIIKSGKCANPRKANYLLLEDLGKLFSSKGKRKEALDAYNLAIASCLSGTVPELCRKSIEKEIHNLSK